MGGEGKKSGTKIGKRLFEGLFWPAAAGNVVWALITFSIRSDWSVSDIYGFILLLLLGGYLTMVFERAARIDDGRPAKYWILEGLHIASIAVFALAIQMRHNVLWFPWLLSAVFLTAATGHLLELLRPGARFRRCVLLGMNIHGVVLLWVLLWCFTYLRQLALIFPVGVALAQWIGFRFVLHWED